MFLRRRNKERSAALNNNGNKEIPLNERKTSWISRKIKKLRERRKYYVEGYDSDSDDDDDDDDDEEEENDEDDWIIKEFDRHDSTIGSWLRENDYDDEVSELIVDVVVSVSQVAQVFIGKTS